MLRKASTGPDFVTKCSTSILQLGTEKVSPVLSGFFFFLSRKVFAVKYLNLYEF